MSQASEAKPLWEAKSCPFCGWVPSIGPAHPGETSDVVIYCSYTRCRARPAVESASKRGALRMWNRRAPVRTPKASR